LQNPGEMIIHNDTLVALCRGNYVPSDTTSALVWVDLSRFEVVHTQFYRESVYEMQKVENSIVAISDSGLIRVAINTTGNEPYFLRKKDLDVDRYDLLYSMLYDETQQQIYLTNARASGVAGEMIRINPYKQIEKRVEVGVFPGEMRIYRN
jgi:hypothetical protein